MVNIAKGAAVSKIRAMSLMEIVSCQRSAQEGSLSLQVQPDQWLSDLDALLDTLKNTRDSCGNNTAQSARLLRAGDETTMVQAYGYFQAMRNRTLAA